MLNPPHNKLVTLELTAGEWKLLLLSILRDPDHERLEPIARRITDALRAANIRPEVRAEVG